MTIVSIRGTHGSGKSTIVKKILDKYGAEPEEACGPPGTKPKTFGYTLRLPNGSPLFVVGPYKTACGGCDAIQPYSDIWEHIYEWAGRGYDVLFEGALVSSSYGSIGHAMNLWETQRCTPCYFAFLDTPLEVCLERIRLRRAAKGNFEPVNPHNTTVKFHNVARTKAQMAKLGSQVRIVDIDHTRATQQVLKLFGVNIRKEL